MEQPDARSQFQAPIEERGLSLELREIARQGRHTPKPREHQATGALSDGRRAFGHEVIQRSEENTVGGASIGQSGMAHTSAFSPMGKGTPTRIVAPFGQQDGVRVQAIEVTAQTGSAGSSPAPDIQSNDASHGSAKHNGGLLRSN